MSLIITPVGLQPQWMAELARFADPRQGVFLPYTSSSANERQFFWNHLVPEAIKVVGAGQVIIVASYTVGSHFVPKEPALILQTGRLAGLLSDIRAH
jgi:hypothetical protein